MLSCSPTTIGLSDPITGHSHACSVASSCQDSCLLLTLSSSASELHSTFPANPKILPHLPVTPLPPVTSCYSCIRFKTLRFTHKAKNTPPPTSHSDTLPQSSSPARPYPLSLRNTKGLHQDPCLFWRLGGGEKYLYTSKPRINP